MASLNNDMHNRTIRRLDRISIQSSHYGERHRTRLQSQPHRPGSLKFWSGPVVVPALMFLMIVCFNTSVVLAQKQSTQNARSFESRGGEFITPETQKAIDRGLLFLHQRQHEEGWYRANNYKRNVAVTALSGMAFLSAGNVPGRGTYGKNVDKSVDYILACVSPSGFIKRDDSLEHGPMYGHGFATLYLAEVYGMSQNSKVHESLKSATQLIINSQNKEGGWRYKPDGRDADVSVTVCQMMALRAARNCGIAVPKTTVDNCVEYIRKCQNGDGGFRYRLGDRPLSDFPRSAAGVVVLYNAGVTDGRDLERGLAFLMRTPPQGDLMRHDPHYFYGQYYAVQAMWHAGDDHWKQWYPAIRDELREVRAWLQQHFGSERTAQPIRGSLITITHVDMEGTNDYY